MVTDLELFADYFQIHVLDDGSEGDLSDAWTEQAVLDGLALTEGALAIGTLVNVTVAVSVHILAQQPADDTDDVDHVVEASLNLTSGTLVVLGCTDYLPDAARFDMPTGWTRIRSSRRNLAAVDSPDPDPDPDGDGDGEDEPEDTEEIRLQAWPAPYSEARVIKRWTRPDA